MLVAEENWEDFCINKALTLQISFTNKNYKL
jgi:hypothetical protein